MVQCDHTILDVAIHYRLSTYGRCWISGKMVLYEEQKPAGLSDRKQFPDLDAIPFRNGSFGIFDYCFDEAHTDGV